MDEYTKLLEEVCGAVERIYGLHDKEEGKVLSDMDIRELIPLINRKVSTSSEEEIDNTNLDVFPHVGLMSHLSMRMLFTDKIRIEFSGYKHKNEIVKILKTFTSAKVLKKEGRSGANRLIQILDEIDKTELKLRFGLGYRYFRLFIVMILHSNYVEASVVSRAILSQLEGEKSNVGKAR